MIRLYLRRLLYRTDRACFACGKPGRTPCPGHEYGGLAYTTRLRRWTRVLPEGVLGWLA